MAKNAAVAEAPKAKGEGELTIPEVVTQLVKVSKGKGMVTYDHLNAILPDAASDPEQLEQILEQLEAKNIELVEEISEDAVADLGGDAEEEEGPSIYEDVNPLASEAEFAEKIDDPVRMYLSQMGEIPLLTRDQEIELARRIEIYRDGFRVRSWPCPKPFVAASPGSKSRRKSKSSRRRTPRAMAPRLRAMTTLERAESHLRSLYRHCRAHPAHNGRN